ncbi:MAG: hypothetical protein U0736_26720 [Gemmataceae bacterium]
MTSSVTGSTALGGAEVKTAGTTTTLKVEVTGITGGAQTLDVYVNGTSVGQLSVSAEGQGTVTLTNPTVTIAVGTTIEVKDATGVLLSGTFAQAIGRFDGHHGGGHHR